MKRPNSKSKLVRTLIWIFGTLGGLVLVYMIAMNMMMAQMNSEVPTDLDYSTTRLSENGLFNVSYITSVGAVPVNQLHQWTLHIVTSDGQPVENATITVDGDMPQHGHGLPTQPRITKNLGNGDYLVDGMKFQMGGWWVMDFNVTANGKTDSVHFNMILK